MRRNKLRMMASIALLAVAPAFAEEGDQTEDPEIQASERSIARSNALKARYEAAQAAATARFAPLQNLAGEGNVERGEGAGQIEAAYLAAVATQRAAELIDQSVADRAPGRTITLLWDDTAFSMEAFAAFQAETIGIRRAFAAALAPALSCPVPAAAAAEGPDSVDASASAAIALAGALGNLLRSDIHIQGVGDLDNDEMLALALAGLRPGTYVRPETIYSPQIPDDNEVLLTLAELDTCRAAAAGAVAALGDSEEEAVEARRAPLQAAINRYDTFLTSITTAGEDGTVRLATVMRQSVLESAERPVLRVQVQRGGGSLITRRNIWTAFGAPALSTSGGVIVSYSLTDSEEGATLAAGFFVCNSGMHDIRRAQRLEQVRAICRPDRAAP